MKWLILLFVAFVGSAAVAADMETRLQTLHSLKIENGTIDAVEYKPDGTPPRVSVKATLRPAPESHIKIEVSLPEPGKWNGKFLGMGNGGEAGQIHSEWFGAVVAQGFAAAQTDMGTSAGRDSGVGNPEVWKDFGHRATHLMTVEAKRIIEAFYGEPPKFSYFSGLSTGGQQGLQSAQRYPEDYDGIVVGIPAHYRTRLHAYFLWNDRIMQKCPFTPEQDAAITAAAREYMSQETSESSATCIYAHLPENLAGKVILNPHGTAEDIEAIIALARSKEPSLTDAHAAALRDLFDGPKHAVTGERIFGGIPLGASLFSRQAGHMLYPLRWALGGTKTTDEMDFGEDIDRYFTLLSPHLDAADPDLSAFAKRGGKLVVVVGAVDALTPYHAAVDYYERVVERFGGADEALKKVQDFFRLYIIPDLGHERGGAELPLVVKWREEGIAPETITVRHGIPVPPYPAVPAWDKESKTWKTQEGKRGIDFPLPHGRK